ncbi:MAG: hypothetical protein ACXAEI_19975 [Candidatus Hodarchaeales archaeon]
MWRDVAARKELIASLTVQNGSFTGASLPPEVLAAYDAPFPDKSYKAGVQAFPLIVPLSPDDPGAAEIKEARQKLQKWNKPAIGQPSQSRMQGTSCKKIKAKKLPNI